MPIYDFKCEGCGKVREDLVRLHDAIVLCCDTPMTRLPPLIAFFMLDGEGYPSRRKWMDRYTPDSPSFPTSSYHGEKS